MSTGNVVGTHSDASTEDYTGDTNDDDPDGSNKSVSLPSFESSIDGDFEDYVSREHFGLLHDLHDDQV